MEQTLAAWAASHETDEAIAEAIAHFAQDNLDEQERIWQDPTPAEVLAIWERVTRNGLETDDLPWGETTLRQVMTDLEDWAQIGGGM